MANKTDFGAEIRLMVWPNFATLSNCNEFQDFAVNFKHFQPIKTMSFNFTPPHRWVYLADYLRFM